MLRDVALLFLKLGTLAFGGPCGSHCHDAPGGCGAPPLAARNGVSRFARRGLPQIKDVALGSLPMMGTWALPIVAGGASQGQSIGRTLASSASDTYLWSPCDTSELLGLLARA